MRNLFLVLLLISFVMTSSGCFALLLGAGVAGGVAISKDTASVNVDKSFDAAWKATYDQLEKMGAINLQDKKVGKIEANIEDSEVTALIKQLTAKTVTIEIKARKNLFPNVTLAQDILNQIIKKF